MKGKMRRLISRYGGGVLPFAGGVGWVMVYARIYGALGGEHVIDQVAVAFACLYQVRELGNRALDVIAGRPGDNVEGGA